MTSISKILSLLACLMLSGCGMFVTKQEQSITIDAERVDLTPAKDRMILTYKCDGDRLIMKAKK